MNEENEKSVNEVTDMGEEMLPTMLTLLTVLTLPISMLLKSRWRR